MVRRLLRPKGIRCRRSQSRACEDGSLVTTARITVMDATLLISIDGVVGRTDTTDSSGNVVQSFDYDAFGDPLDFDPATADTVWLFGGDGFYDPASGWTYHLARWT